MKSSSAGAPRFLGMSEPQIAAALEKIHRDHPDLGSRIEAVSGAFLGIPYQLGPLGEGAGADFDRDPLYSFRRLDCTTFIEEAMALALEPDLDRALRRTLPSIRYEHGRIGYTTRNHFPETDWIPHNTSAGFIADVTRRIGGGQAVDAVKIISKRAWYEGRTLDDIKGFEGASLLDKRKRLERLRALGRDFPDKTALIAYIPVDLLAEALPRIPSGTIANVVREDKPDKPLLISHQVLIIDKGGVKFVRHAARAKEVLDAPAAEYFFGDSNSSWPLAGLNLDEIRGR